ncbi:hypothetical protein NQ152_08860 [Microbacterium sp. zg.B48]|uniref:hypothetical protein n=1 Tax=Microbacterium sp. zg.B48 TaxID=2969408 RepID=UPI00214C1E74|nr:hypothetical protein [Microbacterium sp. zg.B48]MCR2763617.1 hypothetical protein [Microbacterium sp. zg.B48]
MRRNFLRLPQGVAEVAADLVRVVGLVSVVVAAIWFSPTDAGILALALPALLVPRFVGVRAAFDIGYGVIVLIAAWSNVIDLYRTVPGWDLLVHFLCTGVIAAVAYLALGRWGIVAAPGSASFAARSPLVLVPALGLAVSALWEMIEWVGYTFVSDDIFVAYTDTIGDMAVGGLGALATAVLVAYVRLARADPADERRGSLVAERRGTGTDGVAGDG